MKVLLIDDDVYSNFLNNKLLNIYWKEAQVSSQTNAANVIDQLIREENLPDLILLDIRMPVMNGIEFLEAFSKLNIPNLRQINIVMLTSSVDSEDISRTTSFDNVVGFYNKPLDGVKIDEIRKRMTGD